MGNKDSKSDEDSILQSNPFDRQSSGGSISRKALTGYLASLSSMAHTGIDELPPELRAVASGAGGGCGRRHPHQDVSPETLRRMSGKLRRKLHAELPHSEDARKQLELLDSLQSDEDNSDWASMRSWLVWCMHTNLDDDLDSFDLPAAGGASASSKPSSKSSATVSQERRLSRQTSIDASRGTRRFSHQDSFEINRDGRMSLQSSLESNGET